MNSELQQIEELLGMPEGCLIDRVIRFDDRNFKVIKFYTDIEKQTRIMFCICTEGSYDYSLSISKPLGRAYDHINDKITSDPVTIGYLNEWSRYMS